MRMHTLLLTAAACSLLGGCGVSSPPEARWITSGEAGPTSPIPGSPTGTMSGWRRFPARRWCASPPDTKYWLWVNGDLVVFEGGLKRGPTPDDTYYDRVDLAPYLHRGENRIALLLWHFGKEGFSHRDSGRSGVIVALREPGFRTGQRLFVVVPDSSGVWHRGRSAAQFPAGRIEHPFRCPAGDGGLADGRCG